MQTAGQNSILNGTIFDSKYFDPGYLFNQGIDAFHNFFSFFAQYHIATIVKTLIIFVALFFLTVICYTVVRLFEIRAKEKRHLEHEIEEYAHHKAEYERRLHEEAGGSKNQHWSEVLKYLFSQHSSDWKLSIIEADSMLEGLLDQLGFKGESLGDKLKMANQDNFPQLTIAWEVHTIRNRIAHEGLNFELSQHEAKRIIAMYEQMFRAYGYI